MVKHAGLASLETKNWRFRIVSETLTKAGMESIARLHFFINKHFCSLSLEKILGLKRQNLAGFAISG